MSQQIPGRVERLDLKPARIPIGLSSVLGIVGAIGAVVAAVQGNDVATAVGGAAALVTMAGRYGQAIRAQAPSVARRILPYVKGVAELDDPPR